MTDPSHRAGGRGRGHLRRGPHRRAQTRGVPGPGRPRRGRGARAVRRRRSPTSCCSTSCCPRCRASTCAASCGRRSTVPIIMVTAKGVGDRHGRRPRGRRRRLRDQALPAARAGGPHAGGAAAGRPVDDRGPHVAARRSRSATSRLDPERHEVVDPGRAGDACRSRSSSCSSSCSTTPAGSCTRDTLIDRVWGTDYVGDTKTLDVHVKRLRAKVEDDPSPPTRIVTIRGLGYKYDAPR